MIGWQYLKQEILEQLTNVIGIYQVTTASGTVSIPAIHVFPPQPSNNRKVLGLEVILNKCPVFQRELLLYGNESRREIYSCFLINKGKDGSAQDAANRLMSRFPLANIFSIPENDLADEQIRIDIPLIKKIN